MFGYPEHITIRISMIWFWLIARMLVIGVGAYCAGRSAQAYSNLQDVLSPAVPESLYSFLGEDKARGMAITGYALASFAILLAFLQERATVKNAAHDEAETLYWLEEINEHAGLLLGTIIRAEASKRAVELRNYQLSLLRAAIRAWGGKGNHDDVHLAYFKLGTGSGDSMASEYRVGHPAETLKTTAPQVTRSVEYLSGTRRFGRFWAAPTEFSFARRSAVQIPVRSPLDPQGDPMGLVLGDSPKRKRFKGDGPRVGAACLAQWLAAGELAAHPQLVIPAGIVGQEASQ